MTKNTLNERITHGAVKDNSAWVIQQYEHYANLKTDVLYQPITTRFSNKAMSEEFKRVKREMRWRNEDE